MSYGEMNKYISENSVLLREWEEVTKTFNCLQIHGWRMGVRQRVMMKATLKGRIDENIIASLFIIKGRSKVHPMKEKTSKVCYAHKMNYYSALWWNKIQTHATTWMNFENLLLKKRDSKRTYIGLDDSVSMRWLKRKPHRIRK